MKTLFTPAIALLNRLKYPQKFALISLLFAIPLALVIVLLILQIDKDVHFAQRERDGVAYLRPLRNLFEHVLLEQRLTNQYVNGATARRGALVNNQSQIDQDFLALHEVDQRYGGLGTTERLSALAVSWGDLKAQTFALRARQSDDLHARLIADTRALIALVGDSSNLILDPDLDTYYTMDAVLLKLPEGQGLLAQVWMFGERTAGQQGVSPGDKAQFIVLGGLVQSNIEAAKRGMDVAFQNNPAVRAALETPLRTYIGAAMGFLNQTNREIINASAISLPPDVYAASAANAFAANTALWDRAADVLDDLLRARIDRFNRRKYLALGTTALVLAVVAYLWVGFYLAVMRAVEALDRATRRMLAGDMSEMVRLDNRDELGRVARSFNDIATALIAASAQHQAVVDNAGDGILTIDEAGVVRSFNPAAARIFGRSAAQTIGRSIAELIPAPHEREYRAVGIGREVIGRRGDGDCFPLDLAVGEMRLGDARAFIAIVHDLTERKRAEAEQVRLQEQIIGAQAATLAELSTPLIPISDTVLAMPLIGAIDTWRAQQVLDALLQGVERSRARMVILDITGVPVVDTQVAKTLIVAAQGVRLLGAQMVLTGIRPEVAQTLVGLGIDLGDIVTRSSLQDGIAYATNGHSHSAPLY